MFSAIKKSFLFWLFAIILCASIVSLLHEVDAKDAIVDFHGSQNIEIHSDIDMSLPVEDCKDIVEEQLERFDKFLINFDRIVLHSDTSLRRGLSDGKLIYLRCLTDLQEFEHVLIHEIGHIVDIGYKTGTDSAINSTFMDFETPVKADDISVKFYELSWLNHEHKHDSHIQSDFVSEYGSSDPFEDFAESFLMYTEHGEIFRYLAFEKNNKVLSKKYYYLKNVIFDGDEFGEDNEVSFSTKLMFSSDSGFLFDATKLFNLV